MLKIKLSIKNYGLEFSPFKILLLSIFIANILENILEKKRL
jgi:hypothetical protein